MLKSGTLVRTWQDSGADDWIGRTNCQWGMLSRIVRHSDSHGLCYLVVHIHDDTEEWYNPEELKVMTHQIFA